MSLGPPTRRWLWAILGLSVFRAAVAPLFELFPQEAYYDLYARHLALSYFDHPPLIGWAIWGFTRLLGHTPLALRLCAFTLTALTQLLFWRFVDEAVPAARRDAARLWLLTPAVSVVSLISTPDVPLLLFWAATVLCALRALQRSPRWWLLAGLCAGLCFDGKYTAAYLPIGALAVVLARRREQLESPWLWGGVVLGALCTAPVLIWNVQHGFASFRFQTIDRAAAAGGLRLRFFGGLIGTQLVLLGPALFGSLLWVGALALRRVRALSEVELFCAVFSVPPVFLFLGLSLFVQVKPNWLEAFYLTGVPLVALRVASPRRLCVPTVAWAAVVSLLGAIELWKMPVLIRSNDTCLGWRSLAETLAPRWPAPGFVFSADGYKTSAELEFYAGRKVYAGNVLGRPALEYDHLGDDLTALKHQDALFLVADPREESPARALAEPAGLAAHFEQVEQLDPIRLRDGDRVVRKFYLWRCQGYRGP